MKRLILLAVLGLTMIFSGWGIASAHEPYAYRERHIYRYGAPYRPWRSAYPPRYIAPPPYMPSPMHPGGLYMRGPRGFQLGIGW